MILEARDRLRFMEYCKEQSCSSRAIADQMAKMTGMLPQAIARERSKAAAFGIVAMELAAVHEVVSVGREDIGDAGRIEPQ